jgi:hypothetical protein
VLPGCCPPALGIILKVVPRLWRLTGHSLPRTAQIGARQHLFRATLKVPPLSAPVTAGVSCVTAFGTTANVPTLGAGGVSFVATPRTRPPTTSPRLRRRMRSRRTTFNPLTQGPTSPTNGPICRRPIRGVIVRKEPKSMNGGAIGLFQTGRPEIQQPRIPQSGCAANELSQDDLIRFFWLDLPALRQGDFVTQQGSRRM